LIADVIPSADREVPVRIITVIVVVWLVIGVFAAYQRGYFGRSPESCASVGTVAVTIVAGPLNYFGANPKVSCTVPQPSR
jgi:hypothetical protein